MKTWLAQTSDGEFRIEKIEKIPNPGQPITMSKPPVGVMHTTEGGWASAMSVFKQHDAPTFLVGSRRIAQLVPLGTMAAALENASGGVETNRWARAQIEVVGYSKDKPYSFDAGTTDALASLLATLKLEVGIPLTRPYPDTMPAKPWASKSFKRRHDGHWGKTAGWYGHDEVPENSHWDPGALLWAPLLLLATQRLPKPPKPKPITRHYEIYLTGETGHTETLKARKSLMLLVDGKPRHLFDEKIVSFNGVRLESG
jgi:hypothetical protein